MSETAYLRLRDLTKSYDGRTNAVDGISLDITRGEFLTLLGASGAGKSSVLLMIAGFEMPTAGEPADRRKRFGKRHVWVDEKGKLRAIEVRVGISDSSSTELLEGELKPGQTLVIGIDETPPGVR